MPPSSGNSSRRRLAGDRSLESVAIPKGDFERDELDSIMRSDDPPSLMFPSSSTRPRRPSESGSTKSGSRLPRAPPVPGQQQGRAGATHSVFSDTETVMAGLRAYGDFDETKSIKSTHMAGSRPGSPRGKRPETTAFSITSGATQDGNANYLYLHEPNVRVGRPLLASQVSSRSIGASSARQQSSSHPMAMATSMQGSVVDELDERVQTPMIPAAMLPSAPVPAVYGDRKSSRPSEPLHLDPQQAWYLLRTLVGLEVSNEASNLHRLTSLSAHVRKGQRYGGENGFMYSEEDEMSARQMPILRYLVKHFLLTLPFVRDVTPASVDIKGGRRQERDSNVDSEVPYYWRAGVLPLLRALYNCDLSHPVEQGRRSLGSIIFGIYGAHALERFVSSGLRVTGPPQGEDRNGAYSPEPMIPLNENPFTRTGGVAYSAAGGARPQKGFSGMFLRRSNRGSVTGTPDLAGPAPPGHLEPISNELDSEIDSDEEGDATMAAVERKRAEAALIGKSKSNQSIPRSANDEKRSAKRRSSDRSSARAAGAGGLVAASVLAGEAGRRAFEGRGHEKKDSTATESTDRGTDMVTAEDDGDFTGNHTGRISHLTTATDQTTFTASEGRPSDGLTVPESRNSGVTAPESMEGETSVDKDVTPTGEDPAKGGIISSVVGYFTGTNAVEPLTPATTDAPFETPFEEQPDQFDTAEHTAPTVMAGDSVPTPRAVSPVPESDRTPSPTGFETEGPLNDAPTDTETETEQEDEADRTMRPTPEDVTPEAEQPGHIFGGDIAPAPILSDIDRLPGGHHAFSSETERATASRPSSRPPSRSTSIKGYVVPDEPVPEAKTEEVPASRSLLFPNISTSAPPERKDRSTPGSPARSQTSRTSRNSRPEASSSAPRAADLSGSEGRVAPPPKKVTPFSSNWSPSRRPPRQSSANAKIPSDKEIRKRREKAEKEAAKREQELAAASSEPPRKRRFTLSSLTNSMRRGGGGGESSKATLKSPEEPMPRYTRPTDPPSARSGDWYAALELPSEYIAAQKEQNEQQTRMFGERSIPSGRSDLQSQRPQTVGDYNAPGFDFMHLEGHQWPWGASVPFWKGTPVHRVAWGGFEADVVGVRKGFAGHAFIVRVRRPQRLDEYVLRDESQFRKYLGVLEKQYPHAHVRRVPEGKITPMDDAVDPNAYVLAMGKEGNKAKGAPKKAVTDGGRTDDEDDGARKAAERKPSRLSMRLKQAASTHGAPSSARSAPSNSARRETVSGPPAHRLPPRSPSMGPNGLVDGAPLPYLDAERRAMRTWLRDTLSIRTVGHHRETAAFLLLGGIRLREPEMRDLSNRMQIDEARRQGRIGVAQGAADRARVAQTIWSSVLRECVQGDGLLAMSEALRDCADTNALPSRYQKSLEWARLSLAQMIHDLLVAGEHSASFFNKLRSLHAAVPWFLLRNAFKLPNANLVTKALTDLLLSKRFGKQSLLQKGLMTILDDDPNYLNDQIEACRARIQSNGICEKLTRFVYASREVKNVIRKHAADNNMELVVTIARGGDEPRLDRYDLERVVRAARIYKSFMKRNPTPLAKVNTENGSVRLILDMQIFLRLLSRERDAVELRGLLSSESTVEAMQVCIAPIMDFLRRSHKVVDMPAAVADLQKFLDQLIVIIDALRSRIQDPQKAVRIIARLLFRHQATLYTFLHTLHREDSSIEEMFQWLWTATTFLRRGLAEQVDLAKVLPREGDERRFVMEELDSIVEYHKRKRQRQYELMCRRFAADLDGDDAVIVEGDGFGKSKTEPLVEAEPRVPRLYELPRLVDSFRNVLVSIMGV